MSPILLTLMQIGDSAKNLNVRQYRLHKCSIFDCFYSPACEML